MAQHSLADMGQNAGATHKRTGGAPKVMHGPVATNALLAGTESAEMRIAATAWEDEWAISESRLGTDDIKRHLWQLDLPDIALLPRLGWQRPHAINAHVCPLHAGYLVT